MFEGLASAVSQILGIALIVYLVRYLLRVDEGESPKARGDTLYFPIRPKLRITGFVGVLLVCGMLAAGWHQMHDARDYWGSAVFGLLIPVGIWLASGLVTAGRVGITKRILGIARSFRWDEITEIRFVQKHHTIRLRAGSRKMTIDGRFVATQHLLSEITRRTGLEAHTD